MKIDPVKLKEAFERSGLDKKDLADAAGWSGPRRVNQIMEGISTNINPRIGEAIAKKLKVKTSDIVMGD